jgi:hypothetical protein
MLLYKKNRARVIPYKFRAMLHDQKNKNMIGNPLERLIPQTKTR